jgi:hypothetical protein
MQLPSPVRSINDHGHDTPWFGLAAQQQSFVTQGRGMVVRVLEGNPLHEFLGH